MSFSKHVIGNITYIQRPLVLGQIIQLMEIMNNVWVPLDAGAGMIVSALGDKLPDALAVVLTEEGTAVRDKDLKAVADQLSFSISPDQILEVMERFFEWNPISSWVDRIGVLTETMKKPVKKESQDS